MQQVKPYFTDSTGTITIFHGDCRELLPSLKADVVVTDPPYGIGVADWDVLLPVGSWLPTAMEASSQVALFCGVRGAFDYPRPDWIMCWHRPASTQRSGEFRGFNNWEPILIYGKASIANDTITCPNDEHETGHPTQKPLRLMRRLIATFQGGVVLDPFMGSGTTLRAAKDLGRRAIGIEIEEKYCEIAARRLAQEVLPFGEKL